MSCHQKWATQHIAKQDTTGNIHCSTAKSDLIFRNSKSSLDRSKILSLGDSLRLVYDCNIDTLCPSHIFISEHVRITAGCHICRVAQKNCLSFSGGPHLTNWEGRTEKERIYSTFEAFGALSDEPQLWQYRFPWSRWKSSSGGSSRSGTLMRRACHSLAKRYQLGEKCWHLEKCLYWWGLRLNFHCIRITNKIFKQWNRCCRRCGSSEKCF